MTSPPVFHILGHGDRGLPPYPSTHLINRLILAAPLPLPGENRLSSPLTSAIIVSSFPVMTSSVLALCQDHGKCHHPRT